MRLSQPRLLHRPAVWALAAAVVASAWAATAARAVAAPPPSAPNYYLALGDSLAAGYELLPDGHGEVGHGYAAAIANTLAARANHGFTFVDLGCPGETTQTMTDGGCPTTHSYRGPQLAAALRFLRAHRAETGLVTLDIGANDVDQCAPHDRFDIACGLRGLLDVHSGLDSILTALQAAAGPRTRIIGMNLYDPVLAWYLRPGEQLPAVASVPLADELNAIIADVDNAHGVPTADVAKAFDTNAFRPLAGYRGQQVPLNVARVMLWTNIARDDVHPNPLGYRAMTAAFLPLIDR